MRIGIICPYSLTIPGGVQSQVLGLARQLRELGQYTRVLGPCDGPPPDSSVIPLGDSLPTAANGSIAPIAPDVPCALRTIQALRDGEFDLLHLHEPMAPGPTVTALFMSNAPMVGTFHAAGGSLAYDLLNKPIRWLSNRLDYRFAVSSDAAEMAQTSLGNEYEILFNGVETDQCKKASPWPTEGPTIFFVGRHEPRKGLSVLLDAMNDLPADIRLWIASDGPETEELKSRFAGDPRIEWLGRISESEKFSRMKGADIFCAPSLRGESFGVVLLEGMACDTVVVASDIPGYSKVAEEGKHAVLVSPGDSHALATAIEKVLGDANKQEELKESGQQRAMQFSMKSLAEHYLDSYGKVLRGI
ncbi:MAG: Phosphatidyl-myo-inositol mannosyltransferase [Acidimicrobiales bacterium AG-410-I20]|nr:MAG: Phosphatidyl-myo-inositol mannosyltransferase [Acidimicrobiales bacterium AG-410-I20]